MQQSSALTLLYCVELIESQGSYSLKAFLDRTESENSKNNTFNIPSTSITTNTGRSGKAHRSLLNDPRIKEVRTLLSTLRIEHPKLECLIETLKEKMSYPPLSLSSSVIQTDSNASSNIVAKGDYFVKAIVFTQYRDTAQHIVDILNSNSIKASRFVGQARKEGDVGMKQEEQGQVLESFIELSGRVLFVPFCITFVSVRNLITFATAI
jgi:ERCC4-related helicase